MKIAPALRNLALGVSAVAFFGGLLVVSGGGSHLSSAAQGRFVPLIASAPFVVHTIFLLAQCFPGGNERATRWNMKGSDVYVTAFLLCMFIPYERLGRLSGGESIVDLGGTSVALVVSFVSLLARIIQLWMLRGVSPSQMVTLSDTP
jgi:hypothetical protein